MAFIGNTVQNQGFTPAIDYFNGNGVTVTFTLSRPIASVAQVIVAVDNVIQNPSSAFNVVGNSITFTSAPLSGTNNIWVEYTSLITTYQGISQDPTVIGDIRATGGYLAEGDFGNSFIDGNLIDYVTGRGRFTVGELDDIVFYHGGTGARSEMMDLYYAGGAKIYGTTALTIPVGTTAERPGTPAVGMIRMNTTTGYPEWYSSASSAWVQFNSGIPYSVDFLVVAGGGGGGAYNGGGGGAGGFRTSAGTSGGGGSAESQISVTSGTSYTVTIGAGGAGQVSSTQSVAGSNSSFSSITSIGGGKGGGYTGSFYSASSGGSGGGAAYAASSAGSGTANQGYAGGNGDGNNAAGGGGAGAVGSNATASSGGNGGNGVASSISGSSVTYAGGGGGGAYPAGGASSAGTGGSGGGGNGGYNAAGSAGTANRGGGGGGAQDTANPPNNPGGAGGSGIVIIRYLGAQRGTGGTVTSSGGYTIHTFTSSGTYTA
jgi:hypothetical protein